MITSKTTQQSYDGVKMLGASSPVAKGKCLLGHSLPIKGRVSDAKWEGWSSTYELRDPQYGELTMCTAKCEGLVLVTFARIEKWSR